MSNYEVAELTWENGQLAMHGLGGLLPTTPTKPTWGRAGDTLESIVHQATHHHKQNPNLLTQQNQIIPASNINNGASSSGGNKWSEISSGLQEQTVPGGGLIKKKWRRSESEQCGRRTTFCSNSKYEEEEEEEEEEDEEEEEEEDITAADRSINYTACATATASATFCRDKDKDTTMMTWASFESPRSFKTKTTHDEDSSCHGGSENRVEERETKGNETGRSHSMRRNRAAAIHNQSERRRRDRIKQKMETLQKLVPNASKTDKASMLDEVIEYLKQLQAQVQMMSIVRNMPAQMMMPIGMQQHLQMSLLARMGMGVGLGMGMGMFEMNNLARSGAPQTVPSFIHHPTPFAATGPTFAPPPFLVPSMIPMQAAAQAMPNPAGTNASVPLPADPYCTFLAQSMNMDLYNKMAALYQQQVNQTTQATTNPSQSHQGQSD